MIPAFCGITTEDRHPFELSIANHDKANDVCLSPAVQLPPVNLLLWKIYVGSRLFKDMDGFIVSDHRFSSYMNLKLELFYEANRLEDIGLVIISKDQNDRFEPVDPKNLKYNDLGSFFISSRLLRHFNKQLLFTDENIINNVIEEEELMKCFRGIPQKVYRLT